MALFRLGLNIHPNSKVNIFGSFRKNNFLFLVLISVSLITSWFVSELFHLCFCVAPVLFDVNQNLGRNIIIFFVDDGSDLIDIILAPSNFLIIVLGLSLSKNFVDRMNDIFSNLAVFNCFFNGFVF